MEYRSVTKYTRFVGGLSSIKRQAGTDLFK